MVKGSPVLMSAISWSNTNAAWMSCLTACLLAAPSTFPLLLLQLSKLHAQPGARPQAPLSLRVDGRDYQLANLSVPWGERRQGAAGPETRGPWSKQEQPPTTPGASSRVPGALRAGGAGRSRSRPAPRGSRGARPWPRPSAPTAPAEGAGRARPRADAAAAGSAQVAGGPAVRAAARRVPPGAARRRRAGSGAGAGSGPSPLAPSLM